MPIQSFDTYLAKSIDEDLVKDSGKIVSFIESFRLGKRVTEHITSSIAFYAFHLRNRGTFYVESLLNELFAKRYGNKTLSIPDTLNYFQPPNGGLQCGAPVRVVVSSRYAYEKFKIPVPGIDSFKVLSPGKYLVSGSIVLEDRERKHKPIVAIVEHNSYQPINFSIQAETLFKKHQVTNLYGFSLYDNTILFGTWGKRGEAMLMQAAIRDNKLDQVEEITPSEIKSKGYDDLFVKDANFSTITIGHKLGPNTRNPQLYQYDQDTNKLVTRILRIGKDEALLTRKEMPFHLYCHQHYHLPDGHMIFIYSGKMGSLVQVIDQDDKVKAKYFIDLPADEHPFQEYGWHHRLFDSNDCFLYLPDKDGVIHRIHYDRDSGKLHVVRFRLPIEGEITAISAFNQGCYMALYSNRRNYIIKMSDFDLFPIYESSEEESPVITLIQDDGQLIAIKSWGRFFPNYLYSRCVNFFHSGIRNSSELIFIKTQSLSQDLAESKRHAWLKQKSAYLDYLARYPNHYQTLLMLANIEFNDGNNDEAISLAKKAMKAEDKALIPLKLMGLAYMRKNNWTDAILSLEKYLLEAPEDREARTLLEQCIANNNATKL